MIIWPFSKLFLTLSSQESVFKYIFGKSYADILFLTPLSQKIYNFQQKRAFQIWFRLRFSCLLTVVKNKEILWLWRSDFWVVFFKILLFLTQNKAKFKKYIHSLNMHIYFLKFREQKFQDKRKIKLRIYKIFVLSKSVCDQKIMSSLLINFYMSHRIWEWKLHISLITPPPEYKPP